MIKSRNCPICGEEIKFSYVVPERSYIIEQSEIVRDDAHEGIPWDNPYLKFYCSNDMEHDIDKDTIVYEKKFDEWHEEISNEFYEQNLYVA